MMLGYRIPERYKEDIQDFSILIEKKIKGEVDEITFKAKRVAFGIYEQRVPNTYMIRIRCPAGIITPAQLKVLSDIAKNYGSGRLHITTRQEIQIHSVSDISKVPEVLNTLYDANLSTRGGGGNTVRNIVAPADSGITDSEIFDVSPYAIELTNLLITDDNSWNLPRKFKINFSYNSNDTGLARIADVGFIAKTKGKQNGFEVYVAGGLGVKSRVAKKLFDFIPAEDAWVVAESVKLLFFNHGNRKNRHQARLRFLWDKIGEGEFKSLFERYYREVKDNKYHLLNVDKIENYCENENIEVVEISDVERRDFEDWKKRFVSPQRQEDLFAIEIPLFLGDIDYETLSYLADFLKPYGENIIRFTTRQNILLRNIHRKYLPNFYHLYKERFGGIPYFSDHLIVCAGADTCKLGLCLSRNLARVILERIDALSKNTDGKYIPTIKISGCPNCCGQHWTGDIGFYGFAARMGERVYPAYYVLANHKNTRDEFSFAEKIGEIPAKSIPEFIKVILGTYFGGDFVDFNDFYNKSGKDLMQRLLRDYKVPSFEDSRDYYYDWGSQEVFSLSSRSTGECSAGFFDFIERDQVKIHQYREKISDSQGDELIDNLRQLAYFSARMLLITRGIEAEKFSDVIYHFSQNFIETGYISSNYKQILFSILANDRDEIMKGKEIIIQLSKDVEKLYDSMDTNFQFHIDNKSADVDDRKKEKREGVARFKDLRGVACPMNFVKTKLELSFIRSGEILEIYLDDGEPIQNVPGSLRDEGHQILSIEKIDNYYSVLIKKA